MSVVAFSSNKDKTSKVAPAGLGKDFGPNMLVAVPKPEVIGAKDSYENYSLKTILIYGFNHLSHSSSPNWLLLVHCQPVVDLESYMSTLHKKIVTVEKMVQTLCSIKGSQAQQSNPQIYAYMHQLLFQLYKFHTSKSEHIEMDVPEPK